MESWRDGARFLFVSPHPDDVELGCGGTIAGLVRAGKAAEIAVFTDGRLGTRDPAMPPAQLARIRAGEQAHAAQALGAGLRMLGLPDGGPHDYYALRDLAVALLRDVQPDWVFVCDPFLPYEAHSDHRVVGLAVSEAVLLSGLPHYAAGQGEPFSAQGIVYYFPRRATEHAPLDEQCLAARREAIACHRSQFGPDDRYLSRLEKQLARQGALAGAVAAEALHARRASALHLPEPQGEEG